VIPYGRQNISQADIDAVVEVLRSPFLTQGPAVPHFEEAVARQVGVGHAVAVNSATSALHVACLALGLGPGKLLWTVPNTFVASANCARYCGAEVDFVDIDPVTWDLSVPALERRLEAARAAGRLPDVVVPVHLGGQPTQQELIWALAQRHGFKVIEDASHSIGASRNGEPVGTCRWSDITVFSFHPVKIITSGEGGMALTRSSELAERMRLFRSHGITRDPARFVGAGSDSAAASVTGAAPASWYYEQQVLGLNYRMTDIEAALGTSQLERLQANVTRRNELAERYASAMQGWRLRLPVVNEGNRSAFHLYVIRLIGDDAARHRRVFDQLRRSGLGVNLHYQPVHLQPYYRALGFRAGQFPESEAYGRSAITLPLFPGLSIPAQDQVVEYVRRALEPDS
jgi:UDP-4-amino-4,6-dideoxy-N-acetyl-beta-L-altrosamine transaminase